MLCEPGETTTLTELSRATGWGHDTETRLAPTDGVADAPAGHTSHVGGSVSEEARLKREHNVWIVGPQQSQGGGGRDRTLLQVGKRTIRNLNTV